RLRRGQRSHCGTSSWSYRPLLDPLVGGLFVGQRHDTMYEHSRGVDVVGLQLTGLDELLDLGDGDAPARRGHGVEVACCTAVAKVAVPVALPRAHQGVIGDDRLLEDELLFP